VILGWAANGGFIACNLGTLEIAFCEFTGILQRAGALFLARPGCRNSRIPEAHAMSPADNFLQKQEKQRERRLKKGRGGNPLRGPRN
jgi:hypothetical protein